MKKITINTLFFGLLALTTTQIQPGGQQVKKISYRDVLLRGAAPSSLATTTPALSKVAEATKDAAQRTQLAKDAVQFLATFNNTPDKEESDRQAFAAIITALNSGLTGIRNIIYNYCTQEVDAVSWDKRSMVFENTFSGTTMSNVALHPTKPVLAAGANYGKIYLWDVETKKQIAIWNIYKTFPTTQRPATRHYDPITHISFSPDGTLLAVRHGRNCYLLNMKGKGQALVEHCREIYWPPQGDIFASMAHIYNRAGNQLARLPRPIDNACDLHWSCDGQLLATSSRSLNGEATTALICGVDGKEQAQLQNQSRHWSTTPLRWSPTEKVLIYAATSNSIQISHADGTQKATCQGHERDVAELCFSSCGQYFASKSFDNTVRTWNLDGKALAKIENVSHPENPISGSCTMAWSEQFLALKSSDHKTIQIHDAQGRELTQLPAPRSKICVRDIAWSQCQKSTLACLYGTSNISNRITVWQAAPLGADLFAARCGTYLETVIAQEKARQAAYQRGAQGLCYRPAGHRK